MIKLKQLYIRGFKDPSREVNITFSDSPITIIYGENGCGKTTLLKIIQATLKNDLTFLKKQNVQEIKLEYSISDSYAIAKAIPNEKNKFIGIDLSHMSEGDIEGNKGNRDEHSFGLENITNSILFGVNRGITDSTQLADFQYIYTQLNILKEKQKFIYDNYKSLERLIEISEQYLISDNDFELQGKHIIVDNLKISTIDKSLRESYDKGQTAILKSINNAFFSTIDSAINIVNDKALPNNFWERYNSKKDILLSFAVNLASSATQKKLIEFLSSDRNSFEDNNAIFKALIINMLETVEKDEKENTDLKGIQKLIETFNQFIIHGKKLYMSAVETHIQLNNDAKHDLSDLSSGELHLLSFLTLFLILGRGRNFYLIDEPEISMSMKWQEKLLPLLHELSPQSQIIVATHSPEIADGHDEYLVELI